MENTSDSFMPRPLLFCLKSGRSVCYSVPDNTVLEELKKLNEKIEKILSEQLQEKSESNEKKEIPKMYGGLPYTPPPSDII